MDLSTHTVPVPSANNMAGFTPFFRECMLIPTTSKRHSLSNEKPLINKLNQQS